MATSQIFWKTLFVFPVWIIYLAYTALIPLAFFIMNTNKLNIICYVFDIFHASVA